MMTAFLEMNMTYVEFFDKPPSENICACLTDIPERVIYLGDDSKQMKRDIANYDRVFADRGYDIEFYYRSLPKSNLEQAVEVISEIVETYDDCAFDITGGDELLLLALGIVSERYKDKKLQIHRINLRNGRVYDCDKDGNTIYKTPIALSVEENVRIFGGEVIYGGADEEKTYKWDLTPEFLRDAELMWGICKEDVRKWNTQLGVFMAIEKLGRVSEDGLTTVAPRAAVEAWLSNHGGRLERIAEVLEPLLSNRMLTCYDDGGEATLTVSYKNAQIKRSLVKAGQALETKIYTAAKWLTDEDGAPVYNDAINGVTIDWDGKLHVESEGEPCDTENEVDVLLMRGIVPVFISCKNGKLTSDELYKLNTIAERFGGEHAKKVLVTNALDRMGRQGKQIYQRAVDMGITVIKNVHKMDDSELADRLKNL